MKEILLVKHAVGGRTFIHTGNHPLDFAVAALGEGYRFTVKLDPSINIAEIMKWKQELNVFIFQEFTDQPTKKIWYYTKGAVSFDEQAQELTVVALSKIEYVPDEFSK